VDRGHHETAPLYAPATTVLRGAGGATPAVSL
jgi:hypothetical protein